MPRQWCAIAILLVARASGSDVEGIDAGCFDELTFGRAWGGNNGTKAHQDYTGEVLSPTTVCDAARTVAGADEPFARLRRKIMECERDINIVALGGSVSCGHNLGKRWKPVRQDSLCPDSEWNAECKEEAFPALLGRAIATHRRLLCGGGGAVGAVRVLNHCKSASGSNYFVQKIASSPDMFHNADLVVVETSTNDVYETLHDHKESFGGAEGGEGGASADERKIQGWTELLARLLLSLPSRPALVWAAAAWRDWEPGKKEPYHRCAAAAHRPVLEHYAIPQLSMLDTFPRYEADAALRRGLIAQVGGACCRKRRQGRARAPVRGRGRVVWLFVCSIPPPVDASEARRIEGLRQREAQPPPRRACLRAVTGAARSPAATDAVARCTSTTTSIRRRSATR